MQIIKDRNIVENNWQCLEADVENIAITSGKWIIPYSRWAEVCEQLPLAEVSLGVCIDGSVEIESLVDTLPHVDLVAIEFPIFTDGRGYSQARLLRERYEFSGEIRAVGDVLRDQLFFMVRCGINAFQLRQDQDIYAALKAFEDFSVSYQAATDNPKPLYRRHSR